MTTSEDNDSEDGDSAGSLRISRRSAMKAAASVGAISGGFAGVASAQDDCADVSGPCDNCTLLDCTAQQGSCTPCLGGGCEEIPDSRLEAGTDFGEDLQCVTLTDEEIPDDADLAVIKASNECHQCEVVDTSGQTFCIDSQHDISHIEFADCPEADIAVDCPNDQAVVEVDGTDSVYFEVDYVHCDEADFSGTLSGSGDTWTDTVPLANCEGTITVWLTSDKQFELDSVHFDCETAQVSVDCPSSTATISASDTDVVWYSIDYEHCDVADVGMTEVDLSGSKDSATVPVANCEGTITVWDDDDNVLESADFDCETAVVAEVNCPEDFARIHAEDTSTVNYTVDYVHCDAADASGTLDFSDTDDLTIPLANCEGTITLTDDDGNVLDTQHFDCETAQVSVDCPSSTATISAVDTDDVWYEIDYQHCDEADVSRTGPLDLSGSTDSVTVPVANCEGTITVTDDDKNVLATATFDCETAAVAEVNCPEDFARIHAEETSIVNYEVDYVHCDVADASGTLDFSDTDDLTIPLANCEGTITLTDDDGNVLDTEHFDCETASVAVDCPSNLATITASDTDEVWYAIDYQHCDEADVSRTGPLDLSGSTDSVTVPVASCEGTITITDDDGIVLDSASFDCETAAVAEVDCPNDVAVITAEDTSTVNYTVDYVHCDEPDASGTLDFSSTDELTIPLADCEGTITLTDDDGQVLDTASFDCETAAVSVDCPNDIATISAPDTSAVWYEIDYEHCDEADVSRTKVDLSGSTDSATVPVADCEGTITLTDDDGNVLDSATFDCETASVVADCPSGSDHPVATISAEDTSVVNFSVDYDSADCTDESGSVDLSGSTDSVEIPLQNCDGTITITDDDGTVLDSATFETCCVPCPDGLEVKFEGDEEITEGNSKTDEGLTFTITEVFYKDSEVIGACFTVSETICGQTLELTVKTGEFEETADVPAEDGEYCFNVDDGEGPFEDENDPVNAVSHFTIRCP